MGRRDKSSQPTMRQGASHGGEGIDIKKSEDVDVVDVARGLRFYQNLLFSPFFISSLFCILRLCY